MSYYFCNNERVAQNKTTLPEESKGPLAETSQLLFKHGDHLGSASVMTDSEGNLKQRIQYYPYGGDRYEYEAPGMDGEDIKHRFTDHEKDFAIGIYYAQARYYDQRLGRFISCDPVGPNLSYPQSLNPYAYCLNNPLKYVDPTGEILLITALIVVGVSTFAGVLIGGLTHGESGFDAKGAAWGGPLVLLLRLLSSVQ